MTDLYTTTKIRIIAALIVAYLIIEYVHWSVALGLGLLYIFAEYILDKWSYK